GLRAAHPSLKTSPLIFRYEADRFDELPSPGWIFRLKGTRRDNFYVIGLDGLASRWDGQNWHSLQLDTQHAVSGIDVVSESDIHLVTHGGELFHVTDHGSTRVLTYPQTFLAVAQFQDHIYLATAADNGLYRVPLNSDAIELVSLEILARNLERGPERLLI